VRSDRKKVLGGHDFLPVSLPPNAAEQVQIRQIINGQWGAFFLAPASPIMVALGTAGIGATQIDNMFGWEITLNANGGAYAKMRESYARAIIDLLALPTGQSLFQNIIIACNTNSTNNKSATSAVKRPERLVFVQDEGPTGLIYDDNKPNRCGLNLEWDASNKKLMEGHNVLIVNNTVANVLDFVGVAVPPALDLAHELSHFLYALNTPRVGNSVYIDTRNRAQTDYITILAGILAHPLGPAAAAFVDLWNHTNYPEAVNILPSASMGVVGIFSYSDGIMIGEALNTWAAAAPGVAADPRRPQFFTLTNAAGVAGAAAVNFLPGGGAMTDVAGNALTPARFVRLSHRNSVGFFNTFHHLPVAAQIAFRALVGQLLGNITIPAGPGPGGAPAHQCTIVDLPRI
jgi:hypothetical protein